MSTIKENILNQLEGSKLMQIATASDNQPWICSVWYAYDQALNLYFLSATTRRHSCELAANDRIAGAIAQQQQHPDGVLLGLQFEGIAEVLSGQEALDARIHYQDRIFPKAKIDALLGNADKPHKFYRIQPTIYKLMDPVSFPDNPMQEFNV